MATPPKTPLDSESVLSYNKNIALQCIIHKESVFVDEQTSVRLVVNSLEFASLNDVSLNFNDACRSRFNGRQMQNVVPFSRARKLLGKKSVADNRKCREHSGERRVGDDDGSGGGDGDGG